MLDDLEGIDVSPLRESIRRVHLADETEAVKACIRLADILAKDGERIRQRAHQLVTHIRGAERPHSLIESFLGEYGLTNEEGVALMCLAEAMLRVPDTHTLDALIQDKIGPANWQRHLGHSESAFVNASSWGLMLAGTIVREDDAVLKGRIRALVRKLGEPVIRTAVAKSMELLGDTFVLGRSIEEALERSIPLAERSYRFSYDMLGEAALTEPDAARYFLAYSQAIAAIAAHAGDDDVRLNPGISVKLSALHPRYEYAQRGRVLDELATRLTALAVHAKNGNLGFNIDAEEADRLDLSLDLIEALSGNTDLKGWAGLGIVVQAYQKRAPAMLDWLADLARRHGRRFMIRLVKGAYWDSEIKHHQELGLESYPVFTRKSSTDIAYLACVLNLFANSDVFYPQFATHNAHTVAAVLELAGPYRDYEFQRLQGMGEVLHERLIAHEAVATRIYAPVGVHKDLLAYLVRRLLENGANSSFVNQIVDHAVPIESLIADPIAETLAQPSIPHEKIPLPIALYGAGRRNARGMNLTDPETLRQLKADLAPFAGKRWAFDPLSSADGEAEIVIRNPADREEIVGTVHEVGAQFVPTAISRAMTAQSDWAAASPAERSDILRRVSDHYENHATELIALCLREAGKTYGDAVAEVREAVDFLRYYAEQAVQLHDSEALAARGAFVCISPWNFPLAIFTGQIAAALATGNAVLAKPAEQTPLIAGLAVSLFYQAGVPPALLQLLPGSGEVVGAALVSDARIAGVAFTGSTAVARTIRKALVQSGNAAASLVAETGGINAMIVDSTALPEQAVGDILTSAFQSAGQRCSALRLLFLQDDIADGFLDMLAGAMAELRIGDPALLSTDVGPVIDQEAEGRISAHVARLKGEARLIYECALPDECAHGTFIAPVAFELEHAEQLEEEIFGPVLHVVRYPANRLDAAVETINATGFGLTLGLHSRIDNTVDQVTAAAKVGNIYVNRNQIGAVVGVQPFGGEGLSGTGPKAGGPTYLRAFVKSSADTPAKARRKTPAVDRSGGPQGSLPSLAKTVRGLQLAWDRRDDHHLVLKRAADRIATRDSAADLAAAVREAAGWAESNCSEPIALPGPTGEQNQLSFHGRGVFLCLGEGTAVMVRQIAWALAAGNGIIAAIGEDERRAFVASGVPAALLQRLPRDADVSTLTPADLAAVDGVALEGNSEGLAGIAMRAVDSAGPILPIIPDRDRYFAFAIERVLSIDTTASGGNASLLAMTG